MIAGTPIPNEPALYWLLALAFILALLVFRYRKILWARLPRGRRALLFASSLCAAGVFAKIASEVQEHETGRLDRSVSLAVHRLDSPALDAVMKLLSLVGSFPAVAAAVIAVVAWRLRRHDKSGARMIAAVSLTAELSNLLLKETFQRARPSLFDEIATLHSYSFPSGHAMGTAAVYGAIAVVVARNLPCRATLALALAAALVLLIGLSRIYLGVHWMTDVVAGWSAGLALVLLGTFFLDPNEER